MIHYQFAVLVHHDFTEDSVLCHIPYGVMSEGIIEWDFEVESTAVFRQGDGVQFGDESDYLRGMEGQASVTKVTEMSWMELDGSSAIVSVDARFCGTKEDFIEFCDRLYGGESDDEETGPSTVEDYISSLNYQDSQKMLAALVKRMMDMNEVAFHPHDIDTEGPIDGMPAHLYWVDEGFDVLGLIMNDLPGCPDNA